MSAKQLQNKTIRPGSLANYSQSGARRSPGAKPAVSPTAKSRGFFKFLVIIAIVAAGWFGYHHSSSSTPDIRPNEGNLVITGTKTVKNMCTTNTASKQIVISVSARHIWACELTKSVYDAPAITGMEAQEDTKTPVGEYKIYAKQTNTTLSGSDSTGSWKDPVYYWMPFLDNQYGTYGFHDATWRASDKFGNVDPNSNDASHGCVELPLAASKWIYNWAHVGTAVRVEA